MSEAVPACPLCSNASARELSEARNYWHCPACDLRFLHPQLRLSPDAEKARYDLHTESDGHRTFLEPAANAISVRVSAGAEGLDFGCGPFPVLSDILKERGFRMSTYDPYFAPDTACLQRTYDFITATEVAEHLYHPEQVFAELLNLLRPNGHLALMTLLVQPTTDFSKWYYRLDPTHVVFYSQITFNWVAQRFGFSDVVFPNERMVLLTRGP